MQTVLLTRSQADCETLSRQLHAVGVDGLISPMITIHPMPDWQSRIQPGAGGLIFTSRHSLHVSASHEALKHLSLFVVGGQTAELAEQLGFQTPRHVAASASALAKYFHEASNVPRHLLYLSGENIKRNFTHELAEEGIKVQRVITYRAEAADHINDTAISILKQHRLHGIVFYSSRTAEIFLKLLRPMGLDKDITEQCPAFCLSESIADTCHALGYAGPLLVAPSADSYGMITRIRRHFNL